MTLEGEMLRRPWIVVGDIHLHTHADPVMADDLARLVRGVTQSEPEALIAFNGDTFDLDRVRGEPRCGVGAERAARRLERIVSCFSGIFDALEQHLATGGRLVFVAGNHDAELLLDPVRDTLIHRLGSHVDVVEQLVVEDRVLEHGHQSDPDAAFHPDPRTALAKLRLSAFPLASLITRALLSHIPRFELEGDNYQTPLRVLARVLRDYKLSALEMIARFPVAGLRIAWHSLLARLRGDVSVRSETSMRSPWRVVRRLYLDRYFGVAVGLPLTLALVAGLVPRWVGWPVGLMAVTLAIPPVRRKQFAHRDVRRCAALAREHGTRGARLVVLGHIHRTFVRTLDDGCVYANHGAFSLHAQDGTAHRTYLKIDRDGACRVQRIACP
jgi:UDP-2,3-diacylglucosamine pyrophosphatase LpxH